MPSYDISIEAENLLIQLQPMFDVSNNSAVLRKLMALGSIVSRFYDRETGDIHISSEIDPLYHTIHLRK